jgi:hypothetical protein
MKSEKMRWAGNVAGMLTGFWWESQNERDHYKDRDIGGWTLLK